MQHEHMALFADRSQSPASHSLSQSLQLTIADLVVPSLSSLITGLRLARAPLRSQKQRIRTDTARICVAPL